MAVVDERVESLEAKMSEHAQAIGLLDQRMAWGFGETVRRFEAVDRRFDAIDRRFERLEDKVSRQFVWTVGIQVTVLLAVIGALLAERV